MPSKSTEEQFLEDAIQEAGLSPEIAAKLRKAGSAVKARSSRGMNVGGRGHGAPRPPRERVTRF